MDAPSLEFSIEMAIILFAFLLLTDNHNTIRLKSINCLTLVGFGDLHFLVLSFILIVVVP